MTAERLAGEFRALCIDTGHDEAKLAGAAPASSLSLANRRPSIVSPKNGAAYAAGIWHSPAARVQIDGQQTRVFYSILLMLISAGRGSIAPTLRGTKPVVRSRYSQLSNGLPSH